MTDVVEDRATAIFGAEAPEALTVLARYGDEPHHREVRRVRWALLTLSRGDLDRLRSYAERARRDYRDVLLWAEYSPPTGLGERPPWDEVPSAGGPDRAVPPG